MRALGVVLGVVMLGLIVLLTVGLPRWTGGGEAELPAELPGGWTATDALDPDDLPESAGEQAAEYVDRQVQQREYVEETYAEVYDEPPAFRTYTDESFQRFALVTVFEGGGGSFAPPQGVVDPEVVGLERAPIELVHRGDSLCAVDYQAVATGEGTEETEQPQSITCQRTSGERTVQLATQGVTVDDTFALLEDIGEEVA